MAISIILSTDIFTPVVSRSIIARGGKFGGSLNGIVAVAKLIVFNVVTGVLRKAGQ